MDDEKDTKQSRHKVRTEDASAYNDHAEEKHLPEQFEEQLDDGIDAIRFPRKRTDKELDNQSPQDAAEDTN
jgi:hypothetical protein